MQKEKPFFTQLAKKTEKVHKIFFNSYSDPINSEDKVHTYACRLLSIGCFYLAYRDAVIQVGRII